MSEPIGRHVRRRSWYARPLFIGGAAVAVLAAGGGAIAFAATKGPSQAQVRAHQAQAAQAKAAAVAAAVSTEQHQLLTGVTFTPAPGATGVPLDQVVSVSASDGELTAVQVAAANGAEVAGSIAGGKWQSTGPLLPATTYTVTAAVTSAGVTATGHSTFTTLTPVRLLTATTYPSAGMTVGVGQPIVVSFAHDITSTAVRQAIEQRFEVAMSSPVPGGWYWFSPHELHFRPQVYWPAHETVRLTGDLDGIDAGAGSWLAGAVSDTFAIGDARISYANLQTEQMVVTVNGQTVYDFPISGGRQQYPTMDGNHIVLDRESVVHMVSSTVGIPVNSPNGYDEYVYDDVHISDSGEYVHAAPWSVGSQGRTNVSHGCINVSPANAQSFFGFSRVGDVVEVTGSPRPPAYGDHGVMDWSTPWAQWAPGKVVPINPPKPAPTTTSTVAPTSIPATSPSTTAAANG